MKNNAKFNEFFIDELRDIYYAEQLLIKALPKMAEHAQSDRLADAFRQHLQETEEQVDRLEQIFQLLNTPAKGKKCDAMTGLVEEGKELMKTYSDSPLSDAALISAAQKVEHYEIASYGCLATWADLQGLNEVADLLRMTLDEEKNADITLTEIAETEINAEAFAS